MDEELGRYEQKIQADNNSIAIGEINIAGTVTGNITIGHTIVHRAACPCRCAADVLDPIVATLGNPLARLGMAVKKIAEKAKEETNYIYIEG